MKLLIFCRRAKELARRVLHGWYEKSLTVEDLLAEADGGRFTWIGAGGAAVECCAAGPGFPGMQRAQDELPALLVEDENWRFQPLAPDTGLVIGRFRLTPFRRAASSSANSSAPPSSSARMGKPCASAISTSQVPPAGSAAASMRSTNPPPAGNTWASWPPAAWQAVSPSSRSGR